MERSWVYAIVGAAALFVVVVGTKHFSSSDSEETTARSRLQVAAIPERVRSEGGGWIARPGDADEPGAGTRPAGSTFQRGGSAGIGRGGPGGSGPDDVASGRRGASVFVDRGRSGTSGGGTGLRGTIPGGSGADAIQVGSAVPAADVPFEGARPITGPLGGRADHTTQETVHGTTDKPADGSNPVPADGGPVLSLPFDKSTQPDRGDSPVFEQGVTFDSGDGAVFSTDSQFVVPNGGNLTGAGGAISMWVQPEWAGGDASNASLAQLRNQNQWEDRLQIFKNGVYMRFLMSDNSGQESNIGLNISDWQPGDWHHLVATWGQNDSGQLTQSFYADGKLIGQVPVTGQFQVRPGTPLYIGSDLPNGVPGANGAISQFQAYNRPLTPDEVANLATSRTSK
jgi:hypothetical protein